MCLQNTNTHTRIRCPINIHQNCSLVFTNYHNACFSCCFKCLKKTHQPAEYTPAHLMPLTGTKEVLRRTRESAYLLHILHPQQSRKMWNHSGSALFWSAIVSKRLLLCYSHNPSHHCFSWPVSYLPEVSVYLRLDSWHAEVKRKPTGKAQ